MVHSTVERDGRSIQIDVSTRGSLCVVLESSVRDFD